MLKISMLILLILTILISIRSTSSSLNPAVMNQLAAQIPIPTNPKEMHEAIKRYHATVDMFIKESQKYRITCRTMFFRYELETGKKIMMLHGTTPDKLCGYFSDRLRNGYPVPEVHMIINDLDT